MTTPLGDSSALRAPEPGASRSTARPPEPLRRARSLAITRRRYRVVLVYPRTRSITVNPPLGIAYLAAMLRRLPGVDVRIHDCEKRRETPRRSAERIAELSPDLVGLSLSTPNYSDGRELIQHLQALPDPPVVAIGGPHVSAMAEPSVKHLGVHYGFIGESELTFPALVERLRDADVRSLEPGAPSPVDVSDVPGVVYRTEDGAETSSCMGGADGIVRQERNGWNESLDDLPWPAFDLMDLPGYPPNPHQLLYRHFPVAPIMTSRGCPYECTFCASPTITGRAMRYRSPENVVDEMQFHHERFGIREFHIEDDVFNIKRSHVVGVCEEILRRDLKIEWKCPNGVRIDRLDPELIRLMKRSGCYQLSLGIETGDEDVLSRIKKKFRLGKNEGVVNALRAEGIEVLGLFILGFPGESRASVESTIRYSLSKPFNLAHFSVFSYLPGSEEARRFYEGRDPEEVIEELSRDACYYTPIGNGVMSGPELKSLQRQAVLKFYLRPKQFTFFASRLRPRQIATTANVLVKYLHG